MGSWGLDFYGRNAPPSRRPPRRFFLELLCIFSLHLPLSCGPSVPAGPPPPVPTLASSQEAALAFGSLRRRWFSASRPERKAMREEVEALRSRFAQEQVARQADLYLAWIALESGDFDESLRLASLAAAPHPGHVRLLAQLIEGATLSRSGAPEQALQRLLPLVGQLIDVHARDLLHEEAVISAITAQRWQDALWLLDVWLRDVSEEDQQAVLDIARALLGDLPASSIEDELTRRQFTRSLDEKKADALDKILLRHLAAVALQSQDSALARRLLGLPNLLPLLGESAAPLFGLAARNDAPQVNGRQIGLLLADGSSELGERSAQVSLGVLAALRSLGPSAPRLVARQASLDGLPTALLSLDAEGVLVLIGGGDAASAGELARFAEQRQIAALLLHPPAGEPPSRWAFPFGPAPGSAADALRTALARQGARRPVLVGDAEGAVPCLALPPPGQLQRFPTGAWKAQGVDALLLLGSARCARDAIEEARAAGLSLRIALGLEAAALLQPEPPGVAPSRRSLSALAAGLGCYPETRLPSPDSSLPSYWQRLASDAASVASRALEGLPDDRTLDTSQVRSRRESVRGALERANPSSCTGLRPAIRMNPPPWRIVEPRDLSSDRMCTTCPKRE